MQISICIPQYNRCAHLLRGLESIRRQTFKDVEVVVSDDCSKDDSREKVPAYLAQSGMRYKFIEQPVNLGYDANLRAALGGATGDYLFILGNDDELVNERSLEDLARLLSEHRPDLVIGNVINGQNGSTITRVTETRSREGNVELAVKMFRALSCVTGLIFSRESFTRYNTSRYDGSVFVQMYLGARILASGGKLLTIDTPVATTCTSAEGKPANSHTEKLPEFNGKLRPITGGLDDVGHVVYEAIAEYVEPAKRKQLTRAIFGQLFMCSYAYWLYNYRSNGGAWAAFNLALGCFPPRLLAKVDKSLLASASVLPHYVAATASGIMPLTVVSNIKDYAREYSLRQRSAG